MWNTAILEGHVGCEQGCLQMLDGECEFEELEEWAKYAKEKSEEIRSNSNNARVQRFSRTGSALHNLTKPVSWRGGYHVWEDLREDPRKRVEAKRAREKGQWHMGKPVRGHGFERCGFGDGCKPRLGDF